MSIAEKVVFFLSLLSITDCFIDITSRVFDSDFDGILSAFGDFNSDKLTDIFVIGGQDNTVEVFLAQDKEPFLTKSSIQCRFEGDIQVTSIAPGDYDGDSHMDVLVTLKSRKQDETNHTNVVKILWGDLVTLDCIGNLSLPNIRGQPLVMDYDANKIPDLFVESENGSRQAWIISSNRTLLIISISGTNATIRHPHSNAFLDLNNDMAADIFVTLQEKQFEVWYNEKGYFMKPTVGSFPNVAWIGQSNFVDIDVDGILDHVVPVCQDANFQNCSVQVLVHDKWLPVSAPLHDGTEAFGFINDNKFPSTLRAGDYNLDGYPDLVVVLQGLTSKKPGAFLLENVPCKGCRFPRRLVINSKLPAGTATAIPVIVAFYDVYQDGNLDILVVGKEPKLEHSWTTSALENSVANDVSFIKILVLSGLCYYRCQHGHKPFGVNQPGPIVKYTTVRPDGSLQKGCAAQLPQSAHFALHLPYTVFGLGQTPNFVDDLKVGIPRSPTQESHTHMWHAIIPNSQMIVIPLQEDGGRYRWLNKLFVTPSHQVLITFVSLIGTCVFLIVIISVLHWKEKVEDKKEKLQEAHRFHFDAM